MQFIRIRKLREDFDYTQEQMAEYLNIKQGTYSDYERGNINIPIEAFIKLSAIFNVSLDYLAGITDVKKTYPRKTL